MKPNPLWQLTLTRLRIFFREPSAIFWTFGFPIALSIALGIAFRNRPPEPVRVGVWSAAPSAEARPSDAPAATARPSIEDALRGSPDLRVFSFATEHDAREALRTSKIDLVVVPGRSVEYVFDPSRPESRLARALADASLRPAPAIRTVDVPVVEPGARYIDFLIPGLIGMNIMSSGMWGIGYVVVDMRTRKLLKRMIATPMSRAQFLWSFVLMRSAFLFVELPLLLLFGWLAFRVGVAGSLPLLVGLALLGALAFSGIGLLVASRAQNTQTVSGLINVVMLPMFIGSGVFFSTARFPDWMQRPLRILPLTALNDAMRAVMIDGAGIRAVTGQVALLAALAAISFALALRLFRWR